jgi:hypothetical protein
LKETGKIGSKRFTKKEISRIRKNILVFAFFLLLSFIFWYLNSLGKQLEASINYPVRYISLPRGMEFIEKMPDKLNLTLAGPGYSIFKLKYSGNRIPVIIDLSRVGYRKTRSGNNHSYYLVTAGLAKSFTSQLRSECRITAIKPDTLFFSFRKTEKKEGE